MKKIITIVLALALSIPLFGCSSNEQNYKDVVKNNKEIKVFGGDIVRYNLCIENEEMNVANVTLPVISTSKIDNISVNQLESDDLKIKSQKFTDEYHEYNGYHIHFIMLDIIDKDKNKPLNTKIESFKLNVDGKEIDYKTPYFKVTNYQYESENGEYIPSDGTVLYDSGAPLINSKLADERNPWRLVFYTEKDVLVESCKILGYVDFTNFTMDEKEIDNLKINKTIKASNTFTFKTPLKYLDKTSDANIIRTSMILKYIDNNTKKIFIDTNNIYKYNYMKNSEIKSYIDNLKK